MRSMLCAAAGVIVSITAASSSWAQPLLSGRVVDYNGNPVAFADLDFYDSVSGAKVDPTPPGAPAQSDKTDLAGRYSHLVKPDVYHVRFQPPVSRTDLATILVRDVVMDASKTIDVTLPLGYALTGSVRGPDGSPIVAADLDVTNEATGERVPTPNDATGGSGAYRVVVEPGTYSVFISPPNATRFVPAVVSGVVIGGPTTLDVTLVEGSIVTGAVSDESGAPVVACDIDIDDGATGARIWNPEDATAPDGRFRFAVVPGSYDLTFHPPHGAELVSRIVRDVIVSGDLALSDVTLVAGVRVASRVLGEDGFPLPGAKVLALDDASGLRYPTPDAVADSSGELVFRVPVETYRLLVVPPASSGLDTLSAGVFAFASDTTLVLSYVQTRFVSLVAHLDASGSPADGRLAVWPAPRAGEPVAMADADASGDARLTLPAGVYDILVRPSSDLEPDSLFAAAVSVDNDTTIVFAFDAPPPPPPPNGVFAVGLPRPNPFAAVVRAPIIADPGGAVRARVHDVSGRIVRDLGLVADGAGEVELVWDGRDSAGNETSAGIYTILVESTSRRASVRVTRLR